MEKRSVIIDRETYNKLAFLSVKEDKYLYELINEAVVLLENKYQNRIENSNE